MNLTIFNRPVRLMVDFELAFIQAAELFQVGRNVSCCFFHFVSNVKKRAKKITDGVKKAHGKNSIAARLAERTKRALMMLPLLPVEFISQETVDLIIWRWKRQIGATNGDFDELRSYLIHNYVRPNAVFNKEKWCVCGSSIRTNNAAESSHAVLNSSVRVSGAVTIDMFLIAIERQMLNTQNEIRRGCPSHTKSTYGRRNRLLATGLSDFLSVRQGVFGYLDHCVFIMSIQNQRGIASFVENKRSEVADPSDIDWLAKMEPR